MHICLFFCKTIGTLEERLDVWVAEHMGKTRQNSLKITHRGITWSKDTQVVRPLHKRILFYGTLTLCLWDSYQCRYRNNKDSSCEVNIWPHGQWDAHLMRICEIRRGIRSKRKMECLKYTRQGVKVMLTFSIWGDSSIWGDKSSMMNSLTWFPERNIFVIFLSSCES